MGMIYHRESEEELTAKVLLSESIGKRIVDAISITRARA